jgi:hypothetical protein
MTPQYAMARSGRGRVWHVVDWRKGENTGRNSALCTMPVGRTWEIGELPGRLCATCGKELERLRALLVQYDRRRVRVSGLTVAEVVKTALENGAPADAIIEPARDYGDDIVVLEWHEVRK